MESKTEPKEKNMTSDSMTIEINDWQNKKFLNSNMLHRNKYQEKMNDKHAVTISIYTETTVKIVKLCTEKYTLLTVQDIK